MSLEVHGVACGDASGVQLDAMETMMDERIVMQCRQELDRVERMSKVRSSYLSLNMNIWFFLSVLLWCTCTYLGIIGVLTL